MPNFIFCDLAEKPKTLFKILKPPYVFYTLLANVTLFLFFRIYRSGRT